MPSPFYAADAIYGLRALLGTSNVSDIDAGFAALRDDVASKMKGAVPRVTSLPTVGPSGSGPLVDGQECYLVVDATNQVVWHLRYNAAASAYKWEFVGGSALRSHNGTVPASGSSSTAAAVPTGTTITVPRTGEYELRFNAIAHITGGAATSYMLVFIDPTTVIAVSNSGEIAISATNQPTGGGQQSAAGETTAQLAAGATISLAYQVVNTGTAHFDFVQTISARPIRVI